MKITDAGVITPETYAEIIHYAWEVYRRTQQVPWPAAGGKDLLMAQSRLWHLAEPYASGRESAGADLDAIRAATGDLIEAVHRYCGDADGAFASGQDGRAAA